MAKPRQFDVTHEQMQDFLNGDTSAQEIAIILGCESTTVYRRLKELGVPKLRKGRRRAILSDSIIDAYRKGASIKSLHKRAGVSYTTMFKCLIRQGAVEAGRRPRKDQGKRESVARLRAAGWTWKSIGNELGISGVRAWQIGQEAIP